MVVVWHVGDVVRKLRMAKRLNQTALGERAGAIDKGTISRLENGGEDAVKTETIKRVAKALGVTIGDLYLLVPASGEVADERSGEARGAQKPRRKVG
jgi:transcriptional regulator with XRE-family HTH domain